jgi:uncharacterized protein (DUF4415 family)
MKKEYDFSRAKRGAVIAQKGKTRITIYIDDDLIEEFRERADAAGRGYQTMINDALREYLTKATRPIDARTLRRILREELERTG